jgi:ATP-dependent Lon protease
MKESAQAALSYVRSNARSLGVSEDFLDTSDIHVHVPAGAEPKDGPSAGVAIYIALVSLLAGVRTRHDVAMTGEITLRGRILPVGGIKEKVLAAHRAGIKRVIMPERNEPDLVEIPKEVRDELEIVFVSHMAGLTNHALERPLAAEMAH